MHRTLALIKARPKKEKKSSPGQRVTDGSDRPYTPVQASMDELKNDMELKDSYHREGE